jgi:hypothetical protein
MRPERRAIIAAMRKISTLTLCLAFAATAALAQQPKPVLSPAAHTEAKFGTKVVAVDYSAPSKRGREIMGGLVPYGKVWRTGANAATTLTTDTDLMIGNLHVPAGKYTLYTIPNEKEWVLIVNKQTGQWGTKYDQSQDLGRVALTVKPLAKTLETFDIDLTAANAQKGTLRLAWENTEATIPVMVH